MFNDTQRQLNREKSKEKILQPPTGMLRKNGGEKGI
jgi:hypothetical protein